jgi:muconolactone delta-isomerase
MKYLITAKPGALQVPRERGVALYKAAKQWVNAALADGRFDCHYVFPDAGGFSIANADSHEEVFDTLLSYPVYPFFEWEVRALCDCGHTYDTIIRYFQRLAG